jgi:hypothetical protein
MMTFRSVLALDEAVSRQHIDYLAAFAERAHERDHHPQVVQAHLLAHALHRLAFQREASLKLGST